ncbi:glycoside hydrolase family 3 protein [Flammeovirgaceae bacterium KN852]|uniref:Glycoside hydrolase family 3 protein n=2 Tax=Marinigracilibium pacificum TaxID=2729599 RepID=A0A848IV53_9BACT|nr:glycoside hydrolase family 3 protein [Marinigracilibium pacificum]
MLKITSLIVIFFSTLISCSKSESANQEETKKEQQVYEYNFQNPELSIDDRVNDLLGQLTLEEKIAQLNYNAPAIPRLGIPAYNWWNEALHGVARAGKATVFPQAIGMASTFDSALIHRVATAVSDEARAKFNANVENDNRIRYAGLTFWTPNINIFRDPRWGRGQETYGEDPYLTGILGTAFVKGLQGDNPNFLKTAACAKHYVVHSGPEKDRHVFDAVASDKDLYETYLPAFKKLVEADVEAVMCAYNRTNGEPCCGSEKLLQTILREDFGFEGHVVSDCWALVDFHDGHKVTEGPAESAALAIKSGVDLNCGDTYPALKEALEKGLITEDLIDKAFVRLIKTRFKLGLFDPEENNPYTQIGPEVINSEKHRKLALETAQKSIVLLKNANNVLPLSKDIRYLFVTGPHAAGTEVLMGNYYGSSPNMVTILEGVTNTVSDGTIVQYKQGFLMDRPNVNPMDWTTGDAQDADAIIVTLGISGLLEGEEGESIASPTKGDRFDMSIPPNQIEFLKGLRKDNDKPIISIVTGGSPMDMKAVHELSDAVLYAWYPGEQGGQALADLIFGNVSPSGRLPITFPMSIDDLPPYPDYNMQNRTYRYATAEPMYPFGFGLSYADFSYSNLSVDNADFTGNDEITVSVMLTNFSDNPAREIVQLYISDVDASFTVPRSSLKRVKTVELKGKESKEITFKINREDLVQINDDGKSVIEPGEYKIYVGGISPGGDYSRLNAESPKEISINVASI